MIVTDATKAHAREILDYIAAHPEEHDQSFFLGDWLTTEASVEEGCGTTMCIAGTSSFLELGSDANFLSGPEHIRQAGNRLGLNGDEREQLFLHVIPVTRIVSSEEANKYSIAAVEAIAAGDKEGFASIVSEFQKLKESR